MVGPYCVLLTSVGLSLGGLIVGSTASFVIHKAKVDWFNEVRYLPLLDFQDDTWHTVYYRLSNVMSLIEADGGTKQTMMGSRFRIWVTMILLSFPFMSIGASTCAAAAGECFSKGFATCSNTSVEPNSGVSKGLLVAASYSQVTILRTCCYVLVVPPLMCAIAFGWMLSMKPGFYERTTKKLSSLTS